MNDVEKSRLELFTKNHGKGLVICQVEDEGMLTSPHVSVWTTSTGIGTVYFAICDKCGMSLNITDYYNW